MSQFTIEEARKLLSQADLFFDDFDGSNPKHAQTINFNDVWSWACADAEDVPDNDLPRVAELFFRYGWCGVLYWASERNAGMKSEFHDNNRFIEFVRIEEEIRQQVPESTKRAYHKCRYSIGVDP